MIRDFIIALYKEKFGIDDPSPALQMAKITIEEYETFAKLRISYPDGLPDNAIVFLGPNLADGSATQVFDLFSLMLKKRTIVIAADAVFAVEAIQSGFEHTASRGGATFEDLQRMTTEWLEQ